MTKARARQRAKAKAGQKAKKRANSAAHPGQELKRGQFAGYKYPHFSIHRADLHRVLYEAAVDRLGPNAVCLGHTCIGVEQDATGVTARFDDVPEQRGRIALAYDGFHSTVRRQFYPDEGAPCLLYTSPSPRDQRGSRMPSSA